VEWWRTIESLVALLYLVACEESRLGLRPDLERLKEGKPEFLDKWSASARWFTEGKGSPSKDVTRRLLELRDFRNSFEHSSRQSEVDVRYSRLGRVPAHANLSDAIEAMVICIDACAVVRHLIGGLDLMPQVVAPSQHHVFYVPLDLLAKDLILPCYHEVVAALGLTSDVALYPIPRALRGESLIQPHLAIKAVADERDPQLSEPYGLWTAFEAFTEAQPNKPAADKFGVPGYQSRSA